MVAEHGSQQPFGASCRVVQVMLSAWLKGSGDPLLYSSHKRASKGGQTKVVLCCLPHYNLNDTTVFRPRSKDSQKEHACSLAYQNCAEMKRVGHFFHRCRKMSSWSWVCQGCLQATGYAERVNKICASKWRWGAAAVSGSFFKSVEIEKEATRNKQRQTACSLFISFLTAWAVHPVGLKPSVVFSTWANETWRITTCWKIVLPMHTFLAPTSSCVSNF